MESRSQSKVLRFLSNQSHQSLDGVGVLDKSTGVGRWREILFGQFLGGDLVRRGGGNYIEGRPGNAAVPVGGVVTEALSHGDGSVAAGVEALDLVFSQGVGGGAVDVMVQDDEARRAGIGGGVFVKGALRVDDQVRGGVGVVSGVEVGGDDVVAEIGHVGLAGGVKGQVGRAHVGREDADDVGDRFFRPVHLIPSCLGGEGGEIGVGPGV